mgnify:CR=1 FL=1
MIVQTALNLWRFNPATRAIDRLRVSIHAVVYLMISMISAICGLMLWPVMTQLNGAIPGTLELLVHADISLLEVIQIAQIRNAHWFFLYGAFITYREAIGLRNDDMPASHAGTALWAIKYAWRRGRRSI